MVYFAFFMSWYYCFLCFSHLFSNMPVEIKKAVSDRLRYLLDYSFYRLDTHHVDVTVAYTPSRARCVDYLAVADVDRNVAAVASVVVADDVTRLNVTSRYAYARVEPDLRRAVRQRYTDLRVAVHYEAGAVDTARRRACEYVRYTEH